MSLVCHVFGRKTKWGFFCFFLNVLMVAQDEKLSGEKSDEN